MDICPNLVQTMNGIEDFIVYIISRLHGARFEYKLGCPIHCTKCRAHYWYCVCMCVFVCVNI